MARLDRSDELHLEAARGWLGLGNWREANDELDQITPILRARPDVLKVRWEVCAKAQKWECCFDIANALALEVSHDVFGFIKSAYALYQLGRVQEARDTLEPVLARFPENAGLRYDLARYCCKLGKPKEAMEYLKRAFDLSGKYDIRQRALDDPAFEPLWLNISEI